MGRELRFIQQNISDLCKRLDDLKEELTRASVEDQELVLSQIKNVKEALDNDLDEVYAKRVILCRISLSYAWIKMFLKNNILILQSFIYFNPK